jgi:hypothetical protein
METARARAGKGCQAFLGRTFALVQASLQICSQNGGKVVALQPWQGRQEFTD